MRIHVLRGAVALLVFGHIALFAQTRVPAAAAPEEATRRAIEWFREHKAPDGGLPGYGNGYTVGGTADGILALAAADENPRRFGRKAGSTPVEYLEAHAADDASNDDVRDGAHLAGKVALAVVVSDENPRRFGGVNLVRVIQDHYDPSTGGYRGPFSSNPFHPFGQSLAILGLIAGEEPVPRKALNYLLDSQQSDGGWEFGPGFGSDVATSSLAVQALVAASNSLEGEPALKSAVAKSMAFFQAEQNNDGGFSNQKQFAGNFCSGARPSEVDATGLSVVAIRASGQDPEAEPWISSDGVTPKRFLTSAQKPDGSFPFQEGPDCKGNGGSTYSAVLGLEEASFPCLIRLGPCRPAAAAPGAVPGGAPPEPEPQAIDPARTMLQSTDPASGRPPTTRVSGPRQPARPRSASPKKPRRAMIQASPDCGSSPCPTPSAAARSHSATAGPLNAAPAPHRAKHNRSAAGDPISRKAGTGPNLIVLGALSVIVALSVSIGRQFLRKKS